MKFFKRLFGKRDSEKGAIAAPNRQVLAILAVGAGALAAVFLLSRGLVKALASPIPAPEDPKRRRAKWGMVIDLDKCTACGACAVACRAENNVPIAGPEQAAKDRGIFWMDMLTEIEGEFPDIHARVIPTPCNHCENPPCIKVCPVGATFVNEEGIVAQIWARCIGCRYCTTACPYTRRYFNWYPPSWPEEYVNYLNPDVATRPKGVVEKCMFCHHRIRALREKARASRLDLTDQQVRYLPACAETCPAKAIVFGDLNDADSEVSRLSKSPRAFRLQEELGTKPKVFYLRSAKWKE